MKPSAILYAALVTVAARPASVLGQTAFPGRVIAEENGQPVAGARVHSLRWRAAAETDRYGRFVLWVERLPDTLVARFIGRVPDTLAVDDAGAANLTFRLRPSPVAITGVVVHAPRARGGWTRSRPAGACRATL
jgi:hypothetical protein